MKTFVIGLSAIIIVSGLTSYFILFCKMNEDRLLEGKKIKLFDFNEVSEYDNQLLFILMRIGFMFVSILLVIFLSFIIGDFIVKWFSLIN